MIKRIKSFFTQKVKTGVDKTPENKDRVPLAVCALLIEMAQADGEFTQEELYRITDIMQVKFNISNQEMDDLVLLAEKEREEAIDLWQFSRAIRENCSREEKRGILQLLWKIVYTDGQLNMHEDYLIHKLANVLDLTHKELIEAKMKIRIDFEI